MEARANEGTAKAATPERLERRKSRRCTPKTLALVSGRARWIDKMDFMLVQPDEKTAAWDRVDLTNTDKMAIPSRRRGWVAVMVGGEVTWISDDTARQLGRELLEAGHLSHHS